MTGRRFTEANTTEGSVTILGATAEKPETPFKFAWQRAVCSEECPLDPVVRHVALARSIYMDGDGTNCYASAGTISKTTGLHLVTVKKADKVLVAGGWLVVTFRGGSPRGGARLATVYRARIPPTGSPELPVTGSPELPVQKTTGSPEFTTGSPGLPHHVVPRKSKLKPRATAAPSSFDADFEEVWSLNKRGSKIAAKRVYDARRKEGESREDLLAASKHYADSAKGKDPNFIQHASTFFGRDKHYSRWIAGPPEGEPTGVERCVAPKADW